MEAQSSSPGVLRFFDPKMPKVCCLVCSRVYDADKMVNCTVCNKQLCVQCVLKKGSSSFSVADSGDDDDDNYGTPIFFYCDECKKTF
jgi:hypothetical protein